MPDTPTPHDFIRVLAPALQQASSIARALEGRVANQPKRGEATAVKAALTGADTAAQEALLVALLANFPDVQLEAEEDTPSVRLFRTASDSLVVIDPIDGTLRFYLEGAGPYAVMIGLALAGEYVAGLVALPREKLCFQAVRGSGASATVGDGPTQPIQMPEPTGNRVLVSHDLPDSAILRLRGYGYDVCPASGGAISVAPLIPGVRAGLRLARENPEGVSIRGRIGAMIAREAGLIVRGIAGAFPTSIREPADALLVACQAEDLTNLASALQDT
ncbi:MAG: inositol monophosphatase family protein [Myxococcota bacterium]